MFCVHRSARYSAGLLLCALLGELTGFGGHSLWAMDGGEKTGGRVLFKPPVSRNSRQAKAGPVNGVNDGAGVIQKLPPQERSDFERQGVTLRGKSSSDYRLHQASAGRSLAVSFTEPAEEAEEAAPPKEMKVVHRSQSLSPTRMSKAPIEMPPGKKSTADIRRRSAVEAGTDTYYQGRYEKTEPIQITKDERLFTLIDRLIKLVNGDGEQFAKNFLWPFMNWMLHVLWDSSSIQGVDDWYYPVLESPPSLVQFSERLVLIEKTLDHYLRRDSPYCLMPLDDGFRDRQMFKEVESLLELVKLNIHGQIHQADLSKVVLSTGTGSLPGNTSLPQNQERRTFETEQVISNTMRLIRSVLDFAEGYFAGGGDNAGLEKAEKSELKGIVSSVGTVISRTRTIVHMDAVFPLTAGLFRFLDDADKKEHILRLSGVSGLTRFLRKPCWLMPRNRGRNEKERFETGRTEQERYVGIPALQDVLGDGGIGILLKYLERLFEREGSSLVPVEPGWGTHGYLWEDEKHERYLPSGARCVPTTYIYADTLMKSLNTLLGDFKEGREFFMQLFTYSFSSAGNTSWVPWLLSSLRQVAETYELILKNEESHRGGQLVQRPDSDGASGGHGSSGKESRRKRSGGKSERKRSLVNSVVSGLDSPFESKVQSVINGLSSILSKLENGQQPTVAEADVARSALGNLRFTVCSLYDWEDCQGIDDLVSSFSEMGFYHDGEHLSGVTDQGRLF